MAEDNPTKEGGKEPPKGGGRLPRRNLQPMRGFPPPPPGFPGAFPPPPPPPGFPGPFGPPQGGYEEIEEIEYIEEIVDGDASEEVVEEVEEFYDEASGDQPEAARIVGNEFEEVHKGRDLTAGGGDVSFRHIQRKGHIKAVELQKAEKVSKRRSFIFKILAALLFFAAISGVVVFALSLIMSGSDDPSAEQSFADESAWQLSDDTANLVVKKLYRSIGGIDKLSKVRNRYMDGKISYNGGPMEDFYSIEKNGQTYISIGGVDDPRFYYVNSEGKGKKLKTSSHIGPFDPVNPREGEALVNAVLYDELLSRAAFGGKSSLRAPFRDVGTRRIGDSVYAGITVGATDNMDIFCFDLVSNLLLYRQIDRNGMSIRVEYSDFREFPGGYTYPATRKVYIDDKLAATCVVDQISVNRDIMFPR